MRRTTSKLNGLTEGDIVRLVSPASTPTDADIAFCVPYLEGLGLRPQLARHALDRQGYLAGSDENRLSDLNEAIRDPSVRAIIATKGGKGAYRIADGIDFAAMRADPKLLIGFSEITILHLSIWKECAVPAIHGAAWNAIRSGETSSASFKRVISSADDTVVHCDHGAPTASLTTSGKARGILLGGNLDMIATAAGWVLPDLRNAILMIEDVDKGLGHIDRHLTRLIKAGYLSHIAAIAVGQFSDFAPSKGTTIIDVLRDRLSLLNVPILGGLPLGHGADAVAIPIGTPAKLDAASKTLTMKSPFA